MHQCLIQWDGDEVEVVRADDSIKISHAAMSIWDAKDQEPILGISLEGCDRVEATQKWGELGLIHQPYRIDKPSRAGYSDALAKADPCDRPQKIKCKFLMTSALHNCGNYKEACSSSRLYINCKISRINENYKAADLNDQPKLFSSHSLSICSIDSTDDGKLGYWFTSADELEEVDIGPGDKPRPTFISKKLSPCLRELMIALLKEYADCFAWDYTEIPGLDRSIVEHRLPLKKGFRPF
jgi:hypothetical protein